MILNKKIAFASGSLLVLASLVVATPSFAASDPSAVFTPTSAAPGSTVTLTITNGSDLNFCPGFADSGSAPVLFTGTDSGTDFNLPNNWNFAGPGYLIGQWSADPQQTITFDVTIPADATPGDYSVFTGCLDSSDTQDGNGAETTFTVTAADVVQSAAPELPHTGFGATETLGLAGLLALIAGATTVAARVRRRAKNA